MKIPVRFAPVLLAALSVAQQPPIAQPRELRTGHATTPHETRNVFAHLPLSFEINKGQAEAHVKYIVHGDGYSADLMSDGIVFASKIPIRMEFAGANRHARMEPFDAFHGVSNYYLGSDPAKWRENIPSFGRVRVRNVYPGIDLLFYGNNRELEYDWLVSKGIPDHQAAALRIW